MVATTCRRERSFVLFELTRIQLAIKELLAEFRDRVRSPTDVHDKSIVRQFPALSSDVLCMVFQFAAGFHQMVPDCRGRVIPLLREKFQDSLIGLRQPLRVLSHIVIRGRDTHYCTPNQSSDLLCLVQAHPEGGKYPFPKELYWPRITLAIGTTRGPERSADTRHSVGHRVGRIREPVDPAPARSGSSNQGAVTVYDNDVRGFNRSDREAESTDEHATCPNCETPIQQLVTRGPTDHFLEPCGCRVSTLTVREVAGGVDRGRGVATDGGWDPWCDWCQRAFGRDGPDWKIETDAVTAWFCSKDCADQWRCAADTPERVDEPRVATDGGVELEKPPAEVLDGLTIGLVETGARRTVSTDRLEADGVLLVEQDDDRYETSPLELYEDLYVAGIYYVPEYSPAWEVCEALDQLADLDQEVESR